MSYTMTNQSDRFAAAETRSPHPLCSYIAAVLGIAMVFSAAGCTTVMSPISGTPVMELPPELLGERRSEYVSVPAVMLAIPPGQEYRLDAGDIIGVYVEGVLPFSSPASIPVPPPVHFPDGSSGLPPSIGFPIAVQPHGVLNLPMVDPLQVQGMTLDELRISIRDAYREAGVLVSKSSMPVVTLIKQRTYNVHVIRERAAQSQGSVDGTAMGRALKMPAYQNDVLHALTETGGLPGFNERNEVTIFKTSRIPLANRAEVLMQIANGNAQNFCCSAMGEGMSGVFGLVEDQAVMGNDFVVKIPLRVPPGQMPDFRPDDIELVEGDIVYVESRETEFYYTGGLLPGGQFPLPRDYDLDVLGALALAGSGVASSSGRGGGGGGGGMQGFGGAPPSQLFIIRKLPCGRTYNIAVDLQLAMNDSTENILVQPGDTLILRNKPHEEIVNFGLGTFFTYGIAQLLRNNND